MKHFELGQMHKVEINEGFKEIKTAPERSSRSMSQEMEEQRQREAEKREKNMKKIASFLTGKTLLKKIKMIMILVMTTKSEVRWMT